MIFKVHLDLQRDKCAECGLVLANERLLAVHLRDAHGKRKTCPKCGFVEKKVHAPIRVSNTLMCHVLR